MPASGTPPLRFQWRFNGTNLPVIAVLNANEFVYALSGTPSGSSGPVTIIGKRSIALADLRNGQGVLRSQATGTTPVPHNVTTGWNVTVTDASPAGFNVTNKAVASTPTSTTFTYTMDSPPGNNTVASPSGTALFLRNLLAAEVAPMIAATGSPIRAARNISFSSIAALTHATGNITAGRPQDADATGRELLIHWVRGRDNKEDENQNDVFTDIRASVHGDVLHSRPAIVNYNRFSDDNDVYAFYGANDGVLRAVKGGKGSSEPGVSPGDEIWGFVPREHFGKLKRLRDNTPTISSSIPRPYFSDGPISVYQRDADGNLKYEAGTGDKVYLFIGARRGGRAVARQARRRSRRRRRTRGASGR